MTTLNSNAANDYESDIGSWTFVCGRISALESELLPRSFFESLLKCKDRSEARAALGKSAYRILFPEDRNVDSASTILDARGKEIRAEIFKTCPPHPLINFFGIGDRFRTFRTLFNQACRQSNPPAAELENLFNLFQIEPDYSVGLREHRSMLSRPNPPQAATPLERSLYLDSAACSLMSAVAASTPEDLSRTYMHDRALLSAWCGIFRSRWNGVPAEMIRRWFVFENSHDLATALLAVENDPRAVITPRLSTKSATIMETVDVQRIKADIDSVASDVLRDTVLECRLNPFGADKVVAYLVAIGVELINLELCLSAVANDIDREVTLSRLRREYA